MLSPEKLPLDVAEAARYFNSVGRTRLTATICDLL